MDNFRLILMMVLMFLGLLLYQAWQKDYGPRPVTAQQPQPQADSGDSPPGVTSVAPPAPFSGDDSLPQPATAGADLPTAPAEEALPGTDRIRVRTDVLNLEISLRGGDIRSASLPAYPLTAELPDTEYPLMDSRDPLIFVAQSGLLGGANEIAPTHKVDYRAERDSYTLADGQDRLQFSLYWEDPASGVKVEKIYEFSRGDYAFKIRHVVHNHGTQAWPARLYGQFRRNQHSVSGSSQFIYTYLGGAISSPQSRYEKISFDDIEDDSFNREKRGPWAGGWIAMLQHYFVAAVVPPAEPEYHYYTRYLKTQHHHVLGFYGAQREVAPNQSAEFTLDLYLGPKLQHRLHALAPNLELTVDYGYLWFIAQPLFWALELFHRVFGNWGWAIIAVTILIKILFFYPSAMSYRSMANMRKLQPRLMALKERYADDRNGLNQAMMDLYRTEKINPLGGCLPILVQIPVFIALYWVLLESVELRQAPFIGWIQDLSQADPYFILPVIMGATMIIQQKLNPAPLDPIQQKVMMVLPVVFTVFFAFFPAGLVLYWLVNNVLSIAQQWYITRQIVGEAL